MLSIVLGGAASATPTLRDGAHLRQVIRLGGSQAGAGLAAVRFTDVASGRSAPAWLGKRAIVQLAPGEDPKALDELGVRPIRALMPAIRMWLVESATDGEDGLALADRLQRHVTFGRRVQQALPDLAFARVHADLQLPPNDPRYPGQWFFQNLDMEDAWRIESGKPEVGIVVIDNGCDQNHPDLRDKIDPGMDVINGTTDPSYTPNVTGNAHGTACAGLAAASTGNGIGVAGACPGCRLRCVRLLDGSGMGIIPISADMDAFQFVLDSGAAVASNSWGFKDPTPVPQPLADAITLVHEQGRGGLGALVVFAAGNDARALGADELEAVPGITTVGAVNNFGEVAQFSNSGAAVAVVAPTGTLSTDISGADGDDPGDYVASFGGTSSACPIVAGIFGLLVSAAPTRTASDLEAVLRSTAKQSPFASPDATGHDDFYGFGLVQPAAALRVLNPPMAEMPAHPPASCACQLGRTPSSSGWALAFVLLALGVLRRATRRGA